MRVTLVTVLAVSIGFAIGAGLMKSESFGGEARYQLADHPHEAGFAAWRLDTSSGDLCAFIATAKDGVEKFGPCLSERKSN